MTSTHILDNWEQGIHYCGDIDDLIDAIHDENATHYALEAVLDEHLPDLDWSLRDTILTEMIIALEELNGDTEGD